MKRLLLLSIFLAACTANVAPNDPSKSEIDMAEKMGITVEELRSQTPEEHMEMMMKMQEGATLPHPAECEGDGCSCHVAQKPDAPKRGGCGCGKKSCNKAS